MDVRDFARRKLLSGGGFRWRWTDAYTGEEVGSISVWTGPRSVRFDYSRNCVPTQETVALTSTACGFGGSRLWFRCPRCDRRVAVLFLTGLRFTCRRCSGVAYASQSEDYIARTWRRQQKLERRLDSNWQRPKHMRRETFKLIMTEVMDCERRRETAFARYLSQFTGLWR